jgi:hypothetical protein
MHRRARRGAMDRPVLPERGAVRCNMLPVMRPRPNGLRQLASADALREYPSSTKEHGEVPVSTQSCHATAVCPDRAALQPPQRCQHGEKGGSKVLGVARTAYLSTP